LKKLIDEKTLEMSKHDKEMYTVMKIVAKTPELQKEFAEASKDQFFPTFIDWYRASYDWCKAHKQRILKSRVN